VRGGILSGHEYHRGQEQYRRGEVSVFIFHLEPPFHPQRRVGIALEVIPARLQRHDEIVCLPRDLQQLTRGWKTRLDLIRIGEKVHVVYTDLEDIAEHIAPVRFDFIRFEVIAGAIGPGFDQDRIAAS
jgi:hypothetical protein